MSDIEILNRNQQALRLAGVGALLHNLGKISSQFIQNQLMPGCADKYLYQHILQFIGSHRSVLTSDLWDKIDDLPHSDILNIETKKALANYPFSLDLPFNDRDYAPGDLIEYLGQGEPWYKDQNGGHYGIETLFPAGSRLTHLMNRAHHGASGGEKEDIAAMQQLDAYQLWLSTPFGWETVATSIPRIDNLRRETEKIIQKFFALPCDPFPLSEFGKELKKHLTKAIADTRRPFNDVTVWDIGHTGMAFLITQMIGCLLVRRGIEHKELAAKEERNSLFWRVLDVRIDSLDYLNDAASIADLRVRKELISRAFDCVNSKIEQELLVGVEVYRDENGGFYIMPDIEESSLEWQKIKHELGQLVKVDGVKLTTTLSPTRLTSHPKDNKGETDKKYIGEYIASKIEYPSKNAFELDMIKNAWRDQGNQKKNDKEVCASCNVRPKGYGAEHEEDYRHNPNYYNQKARDRNICCTCMNRRSGVSKTWATKKLNHDTIWMYEATGNNGRIALLIGKWDFQNFISFMPYPSNPDENKSKGTALKVEFCGEKPSDGMEFDYLNRKVKWDSKLNLLIEKESNSDSWRTFKTKELKIHDPEVLSVAIQEIVKLQNGELELTTAENLMENFAVNQTLKCFGQSLKVKDSNLLVTTDEAGRKKMKDAFFWGTREKFPFIVRDKIDIIYATGSQSFARIRRVWETTRKFWQDILPTDKEVNFRESVVAKTVKEKKSRLEIKGKFEPRTNKDSPGDYHVYDLIMEAGVKLDVVWDSDESKQRFITSDNLDCLAQPDQLGQPVKEWLKKHIGASLTIEEPDEKVGGNRIWGKLLLEQVNEIPNSAYVPIIPILSEPRTFMALVPADKALDVLNAIKTKYEREMGKVRNRLPLHLGAVFFHRRTPLRAALDAGRRMFDQKALGADQPWTVHGNPTEGPLPETKRNKQSLIEGTGHFQKTTMVKLIQNNQSIDWCVPTVMGDGITEDNWYPYIFMETNGGDSLVANHRRVFMGKRPTINGQEDCWLVHAAKLIEGDQVYFTPATFDFEWLDTSARRFEIAYDENGQRHGRQTRPYLLDDLDAIDKVWGVLAGPDGLTNSQIHALRDVIETRRQEWRPPAHDATFRQFCRDAIKTADWRKDYLKDKTIEELVSAAESGLLTDVVELRMEIMKKRSQRDKNN